MLTQMHFNELRCSKKSPLGAVACRSTADSKNFKAVANPAEGRRVEQNDDGCGVEFDEVKNCC